VLSFITACIWSSDADINHDHFHRFARALNVLPFLRLPAFIEPFAHLTRAFAYAAYNVSFLMIMCFIVLYGFAVASTQIIGNDAFYMDDAMTQADYGTVLDSMYTITTVNLKITKASQKLEDIDAMWMFFVLFHVIVLTGVFGLTIGLVKGGLSAAVAASAKVTAGTVDEDIREMKKDFAAKLDRIRAQNTRAQFYERTRLKMRKGKVLKRPQIDLTGKLDYLVDHQKLQAFLRRNLASDSKLTQLLKAKAATGEDLVKSTECLNRIQWEQDGVDASRFVKEAFGVGQKIRRFDVLEATAEIKALSIDLVNAHGKAMNRKLDSIQSTTEILGRHCLKPYSVPLRVPLTSAAAKTLGDFE